jgi:putative ABC transport system permease protein
MMDADALSRLLRESTVLNSVNLSVDRKQLDQLYAAVKELPSVAGMALQRVSLANFREAIAVLIRTMGGIYTALATVIAFGVVYNSARIALSERARELASLRVLGFTEQEVLRILLLELGLLVLMAQPPGWAMGYGLAWIMQKNLAGELMRVRLAIEGGTYLLATAVVVIAALLSASIIRRRVHQLDLVAVLKTRD